MRMSRKGASVEQVFWGGRAEREETKEIPGTRRLPNSALPRLAIELGPRASGKTSVIEKHRVVS